MNLLSFHIVELDSFFTKTSSLVCTIQEVTCCIMANESTIQATNGELIIRKKI